MTRTPTGIDHDRSGPVGGPPVVLVHAGVADRRMWSGPWPALTRRRDCVRLDLRGFGGSDTPPTGSLDHVRDLLDTLDHLGIERCHLVGASLGAGVCVEAALTRPAAVASLLLGPPGGSLLAELTPDLRAFVAAEDEALARHDLTAAVQANLDTWLVGPGRTADQVPGALIALVRAMQRRAFEIGVAWGAAGEVEVELDPPALERLGDLAAPALVLVGEHDLLTTQDAARRVCDGTPDVRRVDWSGVAHLPSLERPAEFAALALDWIEACERASAG